MENNVISRRKSVRMTQPELARLAAMSISTLKRIETGAPVMLETARSLAHALDCTVDDLFPPAPRHQPRQQQEEFVDLDDVD